MALPTPSRDAEVTGRIVWGAKLRLRVPSRTDSWAHFVRSNRRVCDGGQHPYCSGDAYTDFED